MSLELLTTILSPLKFITLSLPYIIKAPLTELVGPNCYDSLIANLQIELPCLSLAISKSLSLVIVLGGAIVKLPQIIKIVTNSSVRGLSLSSYLLDSVSLLITVIYNYQMAFKFGTYGENCFLLGQNIIILALIISFTSKSPSLPLLISIVILFLSSYLLLLTPLSFLQYLAALTIPLTLSSKIPQILINHESKSTGQLSAFLVFNSLVGCLARVFTTIMETGDSIILWSFLGAAFFNGILALQMGLYWKNSGITSVEERVLEKDVEVELEKVEVVKRISSPIPKRYIRKLD